MSQMPNVSSKYGAPMGRDQGDSQVPGRWVRLFRVRINKGGYDDGGAYWGIGQPLYCATDDQYYTQYVRALDRQSAALLVLDFCGDGGYEVTHGGRQLYLGDSGTAALLAFKNA
jgi:hypothetical protein